MKTKLILALAIAIITALVTQPVFAHSIVLTEISSTTLTATYDGSTTGVTVVGTSDNWSIVFATVSFGTNSLIPVPLGSWVEPENSALGNNVRIGINGLLVQSDASVVFSPRFSDEFTVPNVGRDTRDGGSVSVTFDDDANDSARVPETGSTFGLFFLSLIGLLGATRLRSLQSA